jgi:hypothetical protein
VAISSRGSLATTCVSSFQYALIGNLAILQWSDVRLKSTTELNTAMAQN